MAPPHLNWTPSARPAPPVPPPSGPTPSLGPWACRFRADPHPGEQGPAGQPGVPLPSPQVIIHRLLSMFHPRPFVKTRFAPQGAVACLTAISDFYYTVMFR